MFRVFVLLFISIIYPFFFFFFWFMPKVFQTHVSRSTKYLFLKDDNLANAGQWPEISYLMRKILCMNIVSWLYASNKILQINPPKKAANTHFHKQRDNIKFFFLANKKTDFFFQRKTFLKFQKIWHLEVVFSCSLI